MCLAVPFEVIELQDNRALACFGTTKREVFLDLLDDVKVGDFVIVHAGFAIEKLDKEEAEKTIALFKEITDEVS
jgi:hydrogenase expression/formation protein HypC